MTRTLRNIFKAIDDDKNEEVFEKQKSIILNSRNS